MRDRVRVLPCLAVLVALFVGLVCSAPALAAEVTIGANVTQGSATAGTCGYKSAVERPCAFVDTIIPGLAMTAPCDGTVTRFRLNGLPKPNNHYRLRVFRKNADGSFTGTATSAAVTIAINGVNEYATSLPIAAGEYIAVDFEDSAEEFGLRWIEAPSSGAYFFNAFPADGGSAQPSGPTVISYLYNADVTCTPSNVFKVVKQKGTVLTVKLASAGVVKVASKGAPKLLKPSKASGGPGRVKVNLKLAAKAKQTLREKGKVRVRAKISFTPSGGTTSTQVRGFTVKQTQAAKASA